MRRRYKIFISKDTNKRSANKTRRSKCVALQPIEFVVQPIERKCENGSEGSDSRRLSPNQKKMKNCGKADWVKGRRRLRKELERTNWFEKLQRSPLIEQKEREKWRRKICQWLERMTCNLSFCLEKQKSWIAKN